MEDASRPSYRGIRIALPHFSHPGLCGLICLLESLIRNVRLGENTKMGVGDWRSEGKEQLAQERKAVDTV